MLLTHLAKHKSANGETTYITEQAWDQLATEFSIQAAESGRDREACFDSNAQEEELYQFVTDTLGTDLWEVV